MLKNMYFESVELALRRLLKSWF